MPTGRKAKTISPKAKSEALFVEPGQSFFLFTVFHKINKEDFQASAFSSAMVLDRAREEY